MKTFWPKSFSPYGWVCIHKPTCTHILWNCELLCVKSSKRADNVHDAVRKSECECECVYVCITYECGFISFQETLREKEWKWVKRQDIYNKLSVGLLLLLLLSSSSSSILVYTFDSFNLHTIARKHTHDLHPEIYLQCVICIPLLPLPCQNFKRHVRNVWEYLYACECVFEYRMLATVFTSFLFNKFLVSAARKCVTKQKYCTPLEQTHIFTE